MAVDEWSIDVVAALMRAAYGKGYCDALTEADPGSLCRDHGYVVPPRRRSSRSRASRQPLALHVGQRPSAGAGVRAACVRSLELDNRRVRGCELQSGGRSRRIPVRLIVALSVAAVLAVFLLYTSFAGGATESLRPSQLVGQFTGKEVQLAGIVTGPITGDSHAGGKRFKLKDFDGPETVEVVYTGTIPDLFKAGRHVYLRGTLRTEPSSAKRTPWSRSARRSTRPPRTAPRVSGRTGLRACPASAAPRSSSRSRSSSTQLSRARTPPSAGGRGSPTPPGMRSSRRSSPASRPPSCSGERSSATTSASATSRSTRAATCRRNTRSRPSGVGRRARCCSGRSS